MSFLDGLTEEPTPNRYKAFGYLRNPFPTRGEVRPEVYVPRAELTQLQSKFIAFLREANPTGGFWAIEGDRGVGKSNFLLHLRLELERAEGSGQLSKTAYRYVPSQAVAPRHLVEEVLQAISQDGLVKLLATRPVPPKNVAGTDLGRFLTALSARPHLPGIDDKYMTSAAAFLLRWLSGHQTYQSERGEFGIWSRERLAPAVAFPYLRSLVDLLVEAKIVERVVLLLDEFEDVQALSSGLQTEYVQALKGLINTFNWSRLFVILAGQRGVFARIGEQFTSLPSRWTLVTLKPVTDTDAAYALARAYQEAAAHELTGTQSLHQNGLRPTRTEIEAGYGRLASESRSVRQRDLLMALHTWVDDNLPEPPQLKSRKKG